MSKGMKIEMWSEQYDSTCTPTNENIGKYINNNLWQELNTYLQDVYNIAPKIVYSGCSMEDGRWKGWNIKYRKSGKSLCTVYPNQGWFIALVPIGLNELSEAELIAPLCTEYSQNLFKQAVIGYNGKSLAFEVKSVDILNDVKEFISIRRKHKKQ